MKIELTEQELIDAICGYAAEKTGEAVNQQRAELLFDEKNGISAEAGTSSSSMHLNEQDIVDSVAVYLADYCSLDPSRMTVELAYEDDRGIYAEIQVG